MTGYSTLAIWTIILTSAAGTFLLRWSFLGGLGRRALPEWLLRMLRYTAVAVLPGLVAPGVLWPAVQGGQPDPGRIGAVLIAAAVGCWTRNMMVGTAAGVAGFVILGRMLG